FLKEADVPQRGRLRDAHFAAYSGGNQQLRAPRRKHPDERAHLCCSFDIGELNYVPRDQIRDVRIVETLSAAGIGASYRLWETASHDSLGVLSTGNRRCVPQFFTLIKDGVDEAVRRFVDLALREWPEFDCLHSPRERVRQRAKPENASGTT